MKKWLVVALGLLLAVPTVASAKTLRLAWGTWTGGTSLTTYTSAMGDSGTAFFNGTNSANYTNAISLRDVRLRGYGYVDGNGNSNVGTPHMKIIVTGTPKGSWGVLACLVQKSVDGYIWEPADVAKVILTSSNVSSVAGQTYTGYVDFYGGHVGGALTHPFGYIRLKIYNDTNEAAKVTGAKAYIAYDEDDNYEQVIKPGKWVVDANTVKDTSTVVGFTGRDTTTAFEISDIADYGVSHFLTQADTTESAGAFFVLRQNATTIATVSDSIYITADVSYDGGTTWAGLREFTAAGVGITANQIGATVGTLNTSNGEIVQMALTVRSPRSDMFGATAANQSAFGLYGATHVRFRVAGTATKALPTYKPYIVYWRKKG